MNTVDIARLVGRGEAESYARLIEGGDEVLRHRHGLRVHRVGDATVFVAAELADTLVVNRVIDLGVNEAASDALLDEIDGLFTAAGVAGYAVELSPLAQPADLAERLQQRGFVPLKKTTMLYRETAPLAPAPCDLQVRRATSAADATACAAMSCEIFQFGAPFPALLEAAIADPRWQAWMAFDGAQPAASALTYLYGEAAWIGWVGTLPAYRGRGAQHALTVAQIDSARAAGAKVATLEAATGSRRAPGASLRNYLRMGFTPAYERLVYVRRTPVASA